MGYGLGLNLGLGRGSLLDAYDTDAQAFFTAASITDATQKSAVNQLVLDLKSNSLWTKFLALYPFVGASASTHKFNLKDPRDLDAAFRLVFSGGITHDANGVTGNGTNGYADTKIVPSSKLTLNDCSAGFYSRTNGTIAVCDFGCTSASANFYLQSRWSDGKSYVTLFDAGGGAVTNASSIKALASSRTGASAMKTYVAGAVLQTANFTSTNRPTSSLAFMALNNAGTIQQYSTRNYAAFWVASGMNDTDEANMQTILQTFQTTLSRNV